MHVEIEQFLNHHPICVPPIEESALFIKSLSKPTVFDVILQSKKEGQIVFQARSGVGSHQEMGVVLNTIGKSGKKGIATLTIDSYTRNNDWSSLERCEENNGLKGLNGYPLVTYGFKKARELHSYTPHPIQVRHGSPDPRALAEVAFAAGCTAFEGGPISYNLPYSKRYPLKASLENWRYVDWLTGQFEGEGISIDRETFGTLTAVLVPPSISIVISLLEALLMVKEGVTHISLSFPQTGSLIQDVATAHVLRRYSQRLFNQEYIHFSLCYHMWMGVFPKEKAKAKDLITWGVQCAYAAGVERVIVKTELEALRIPTAEENLSTLLYCKSIKSCTLDKKFLEEIEEEIKIIEKEVDELLSPLLEQEDLGEAIQSSFQQGTLDIPFAPSMNTKSCILPLRDISGKIRFYETGHLPFSNKTKEVNKRALRFRVKSNRPMSTYIQQDILYFHYQDPAALLDSLS